MDFKITTVDYYKNRSEGALCDEAEMRSLEASSLELHLAWASKGSPMETEGKTKARRSNDLKKDRKPAKRPLKTIGTQKNTIIYCCDYTKNYLVAMNPF